MCLCQNTISVSLFQKFLPLLAYGPQSVKNKKKYSPRSYPTRSNRPSPKFPGPLPHDVSVVIKLIGYWIHYWLFL